MFADHDVKPGAECVPTRDLAAHGDVTNSIPAILSRVRARYRRPADPARPGLLLPDVPRLLVLRVALRLPGLLDRELGGRVGLEPLVRDRHAAADGPPVAAVVGSTEPPPPSSSSVSRSSCPACSEPASRPCTSARSACSSDRARFSSIRLQSSAAHRAGTGGRSPSPPGAPAATPLATSGQPNPARATSPREAVACAQASGVSDA